MTARTRGGISGFLTGSTSGSVKMLCLSTNKICYECPVQDLTDSGPDDDYKSTDYELVPLPDLLKIYEPS
jgi:hypothetical protein